MPETPVPRLRLATVTIQAAVFLDDGDYLTPVAVTPLVVEAARLDQIPELLRAGLAEQQKRLEHSAAEDSSAEED